MSTNIIPLLKKHPVSRKENLQNIAKALGIDSSEKQTIAQYQCAIDEFLRMEPAFEDKVREIAHEILSDWKNTKGNDKEKETSDLEVPTCP